MDLLSRSESYGKYALKGYRKWLYDLAQWLPKSSLNFRISLVLRKLTLQNKLKIIDQYILGLKARFYPLDNLFPTMLYEDLRPSQTRTTYRKYIRLTITRTSARSRAQQ